MACASTCHRLGIVSVISRQIHRSRGATAVHQNILHDPIKGVALILVDLFVAHLVLQLCFFVDVEYVDKFRDVSRVSFLFDFFTLRIQAHTPLQNLHVQATSVSVTLRNLGMI